MADARPWPWLRPSWLLPVLFVLSLPVVTTRLYASDEIEFFAWLRSWVFDRDVSFENEYRYFYETGVAHDPLFHETFLERQNAVTGLRENFAPIGTAILWAPFYAVGHVVARATGAPADGFSRPYIGAVTYGSTVYGFLALVLTLAIIRRVLPASVLPAIAVWIGTPILFYSYIAPGFSHACSAFAVSLFLWTWLQVRARWSLEGAAALGLAGALMAMVRDQDALFAAGPALDFLRHVRVSGPGSFTIRRGRVWIVGLVAAAASVIGYLPQAYAYNALNGQPGPTEVVSRKMTWTSPHFFSVLFSPEHGLFFWTPLAIVSVAGLIWLSVGRRGLATADGRWLGRLALVMFGLQVYISGCVESWTVAGAFGQRRFVAVSPLLALGLAALFNRASEGPRLLRTLLTVLVAACIWWNLGLMAQFGENRMDRQRLSLRDNAWGVFVEVPMRAPSIVYRYLTDRASFYRAPRP